ncbi:MAG: transglutaminase family protein [Cyanobacteriota bacterium]
MNERTRTTAEAVEQRLLQAGLQLTMGGEPTLVPLDPQGAEWSVAADGPTKLTQARALAAEIQRRTWSGSLLLFCPGKRYDGEVNPRWALRLIIGRDGEPLVSPGWTSAGAIPSADQALALLEAIGEELGLAVQPLPLADPLAPDRQIWALPLNCEQGQWQTLAWPLAEELRQLSAAPGPAGLRLPLEHFPEGALRQVLTLELDAQGWGVFLPPLERQPLERLLQLIATHSAGWCSPQLSGLLPVDLDHHWQVLGLTADPGVLEINLPVCHSWQEYAGWLELLEQAGAAVGLRSWKQLGARSEGTGGGNHLLFGGPSLEEHPFFARPGWLVAVLRYWQHHPSLAYLFSGRSVGPASQAPRPDEGSAGLLDLEIAHRTLERLPAGDQRVAIGETLRHLHADRSGNTHRSEISLDKFWNPAWTAGCQGLLEFRALESLPDQRWSSAIALLFRALIVRLLDPALRPAGLRPWGEQLHDQVLLPSELWRDFEQVLADLDRAGLPLDPEPFRSLWEWRFPTLLHWRHGEAELTIRQALEPWPLLCDTPVEGGSTSRFVDSSLRRFEVIGTGTLRRDFSLRLQGRPLAWPADPNQPLAVRFRQEALFPCLHPCLSIDVPLTLEVLDRRGSALIAQWQLQRESDGFELLTEPWSDRGGEDQPLTALRGAREQDCTVDLRL